ncbi:MULTISPECIES: hypothetical protein [Streptomyces]|uniref:hypothetical protein n=1 Tax=Streptomyces TaxID=1883 RepID=UPI0036BF01CE
MDKAYSSRGRGFRGYQRRRDIATSRTRSPRKPTSTGTGHHRGRPGGRPPGFNREVATRDDKLAVRYEATDLVAAINEWL